MGWQGKHFTKFGAFGSLTVQTHIII
jgi:hypothetical protein